MTSIPDQFRELWAELAAASRENATLRSALERIAHECRHVESMAGGCVGPTVRSNRGMIVNCPACFARAALAASTDDVRAWLDRAMDAGIDPL